eukprot:TRINITY_DN55553_c0_g1_i1.p1 TRINITY_DN55553_c0_g1~~TRINITY_DN55553_c0_g1_i1.p1  ORF type:complete len:300 (-),score=37.86 TRINITY_DN55553_c0_g1_i1:132-1031(-)
MPVTGRKGGPLAKRRKLQDGDARQMRLDAGQKVFGPQRCTKCGMIFLPMVHVDASMHAFFCAKEPTTWVAFKKEVVASTHTGHQAGRVVCIDAGNATAPLKAKVEGLKQALDAQQGYNPKLVGQWNFGPPFKALLYVTAQKQLVGFMIVHHMSTLAKKFTHPPPTTNLSDIPTLQLQPTETTTTAQHNEEEGSTTSSSVDRTESEQDSTLLTQSTQTTTAEATTEQKVSMGVMRMWVHPKFNGTTDPTHTIAARLMDVARTEAVYGYQVPTNEVAFEHPTTSTKDFFVEYTKANTVLVY